MIGLLDVVSSLDAGSIFAGRELVKIPVVGLLETAMSFASIFYRKVGLLSDLTLPELTIESSLREWNLSSVPTTVESIELPQHLPTRNPMKLKRKILKAVQTLQNSGVDVILPCSLRVSSILETLRREISTDILNPIEISLKIAEILSSMGLSHTKLAYPTPVIPTFTLERLRKSDQLSDLRLLPPGENL